MRRIFGRMVEPAFDNDIDGKPRSVFHIDIRRAALAIGCAALALAMAYYVTIGRERPEEAAADANKFGRETRVGSIVVMPPIGDDCREMPFDNDTGFIGEPQKESCMQILARSAKAAKKESHVQAVSENFRR